MSSELIHRQSAGLARPSVRAITTKAASPATATPPVATCQITTHFTELLQGLFETDGGIIRGLVTLPCPNFYTRVTVEIDRSDLRVRSEPEGFAKTEAAVANTLRYLGVRNAGAIVRVRSIVPEGIGAGSSSGDVVGGIIATARALGSDLTAAEMAFLTVDTEKASDPLMYLADPTFVPLFAHRGGTIIERFPGRLPALEVLGITDGAPVDTLGHTPAAYDRHTRNEFTLLREGVRRAVASGDAGLIGTVATRSAEINQNFLRKPQFDRWREMAADHGAVGISVSHSGSAVAFLFDAADHKRHDRVECLKEALQRTNATLVTHFDIGG